MSGMEDKIMITDEQLNEYREHGTTLRVIRDAFLSNDVLGIVVAWNEESVLIRKPNRKVVTLARHYHYQLPDQARPLE
jgi:hypothetical protein